LLFGGALVAWRNATLLWLQCDALSQLSLLVLTRMQPMDWWNTSSSATTTRTMPA
jgi:hypothetical protein